MENNKFNRFIKVLNSDPIIVDTTAIPFNGDIKQLKRDAFQYGKKLIGEYTNKSDNTTFQLTKVKEKEIKSLL